MSDWVRDPGEFPPIAEDPLFPSYGPPAAPSVGSGGGHMNAPSMTPQRPSSMAPGLYARSPGPFPTEVPTQAGSAPKKSHRAAWLLAALVGGLFLFAGGFFAGRATAPADATESGLVAEDRPVNTTSPDVATTIDQPSSEPRASGSPPVTLPPPRIEASGEPIADIARAVGPAVVQLETTTGLGSGFIYDESGLVMTAAHVVEGSTTVLVRLADGHRLEGRVVGTDANSDVAVVQINEPPTDMVVASLALDEDPEPGDLAVAIGSPFGLDQTVTSGIVSAVNRPVPIGSDGRPVGMVQTDAAINSGNSGGALVNRRGQVIGINDSIRTLTGTNVGVGFAIPISLAHTVAEALAAGETPQLPTLGVFGSQTAGTFGRAGALIEKVVPASGAEAAGIQAGDLITAVDGSPIKDFGDLGSTLRSHRPGDAVEVTVIRDNAEIVLTAVLGD